jgi:WD40 repeat protein
VKVWSFDGSKLTATGQVFTAPGGFGYGYAAFSPDGQHLAIGGAAAIDVYTVGTWAAGTSLTIGDTAYGLGFAPDSQHVISVDPYDVYVHALGTATPITTVAAGNDVYGLAVAKTAVSGQLAVAVPGLDAIGDIYSYAAPSTLSGPAVLQIASSDSSERLISAAISPSGTLLALGDYLGRIWLSSYPTGSATISTTSALTVDSELYQGVQAVAFSPNGSYLAAAADLTQAGAPGTVTIWSVAGKSLYASYAATTYSPQSIAFSPNGNAIAVGEYDCGKILLCTN